MTETAIQRIASLTRLARAIGPHLRILPGVEAMTSACYFVVEDVFTRDAATPQIVGQWIDTDCHLPASPAVFIGQYGAMDDGDIMVTCAFVSYEDAGRIFAQPLVRTASGKWTIVEIVMEYSCQATGGQDRLMVHGYNQAQQEALTAAAPGFIKHLLFNIDAATSRRAPPAPVAPSPLRRRMMRRDGVLRFDYYVCPIGSAAADRAAPLGGSHAPPCRHFRLGHWRTLRSGRRTWIDGFWLGDVSRGEIIKDYRTLEAQP